MYKFYETTIKNQSMSLTEKFFNLNFMYLLLISLMAATGVTMQAFIPTMAAGKVVEIVGVGTTATGGATTSAASMAQGKTTEGVQQASSSLSSTLTSLSNLKKSGSTLS